MKAVLTKRLGLAAAKSAGKDRFTNRTTKLTDGDDDHLEGVHRKLGNLFLFDDLNPGRYTLAARAEYFKPKRQNRVKAGELDVVIQLQNLDYYLQLSRQSLSDTRRRLRRLEGED